MCVRACMYAVGYEHIIMRKEREAKDYTPPRPQRRHAFVSIFHPFLAMTDIIVLYGVFGKLSTRFFLPVLFWLELLGFTIIISKVAWFKNQTFSLRILFCVFFLNHFFGKQYLKIRLKCFEIKIINLILEAFNDSTLFTQKFCLSHPCVNTKINIDLCMNGVISWYT